MGDNNMVNLLFETKQINNNELYCVYMHINKINGKRYIGQTIHQDNINYRWNNGNGYKCSTYFYNAIQKYGWDNFEHIIIQKNLTKEEADLLEDLNIIAYNTMNNKFGYNLKRGGSNGKYSEETKCKMSSSQKGRTPWNKGKTDIYSEETLNKISKSRKNKPLSEETKEKISKANKGKNTWTKGKHHSEETKKKISKANKGKKCKPMSEETRKKISNSNKGQLAWNKGISWSEDVKQKIGKSSKNRVWINNNIINKFVKSEELQKYLSDGWVKGRLITKNIDTISKK